jgi:hypothetical protein
MQKKFPGTWFYPALVWVVLHQNEPNCLYFNPVMHEPGEYSLFCIHVFGDDQVTGMQED